MYHWKKTALHFLLAALMSLAFAIPCFAAEYAQRSEGVWTASNFRFHTGEVFQQLKIGYTTLGNPSNEAVLILHGTTGTGKSMLNPAFGGELFAAGQPLDASKYYIILPDAIGVGRSSKPSDGLRAQFPRYDYDDMVLAQYRLLTEGLGVKHLRLIIGNSMGGMQTWLWGINHPDYMDGMIPMASTPIAMSGRNWLMRKMISESVRRDPAWNNGNYTEQPQSVKIADTFYRLGTNGGEQAWYSKAPNSAKADEIVEKSFANPLKIDANDFLYQWESSGDFNPTNLEAIKARVLVINSADDERNPVCLGVMGPQLKKIQHAKLYLIPASDKTSGHGTTANAKWWKGELVKFMKTLPKK